MLFSIIGALLSSRLRNLRSIQVAIGLLELAMAVTLLNALIFFAGIKISFIKEALLLFYNLGKGIWFLLAAFMTTRIFRASDIAGKFPDLWDVSWDSILRLTIYAASVMCAGFFFMVTIGKIRHFANMKEFFSYSGYPVWLLYVNIAVECVASLGLLLHLKLRSGMLSAMILLLMMLAAVGTHIKNGDPIADSYDAFMQLLLLLLLIGLFYIDGKRRRGWQTA